MSLRHTLASIGQCRVPPDLPTELLIVDNGSTDDTKQAVEACRLNNMRVRHVFEGRAGKGFAYNTGMAEARGDVFLFTDDDVRVPTEWIESMCRPIVAGETDAIQGGVKLAPELERPWMTGIYRTMLAVVDAHPDAQPDTLVGANMAFARKVTESVPGFDLQLGPGASGLGDDTLFGLQLRRAGYRLAYSSGQAVEHHCDSSRLTPEYAMEWIRKCGRSRAMISTRLLKDEPSFPRLRWAGVRTKYLLRRIVDRRVSPLPPEWVAYYEFKLSYLRALW